MLDLIVIGGGAAGFYGAIHTARQQPGARVLILEQNKDVLSKVRISGGGRCNLTHRPLDPRQLSSHYPRGGRELLGPFHTHASSETMAFFEGLGVPLKIEADGRVFPKTDRSQTVIDALRGEAGRLGIRVQTGCRVTGIRPVQSPVNTWAVQTAGDSFEARCLLVCTGGNTSVWSLLHNLGHRIVPPVPSLFTFRIADPRLLGLQGISAEARLEVLPPDTGEEPLAAVNFRKAFRSGHLAAEGPALITHWGLSGPATLRLSAWGARYFAACGYRFKVRVNWMPDYHRGALRPFLISIRDTDPKKNVWRNRATPVPGRLWAKLAEAAGIGPEARWAEISSAVLDRLVEQLTGSVFQVDGKSTFKEEFVTAGGVSLKDIHFRSFESKKCPGLFMAGEVLDIDALTGGFNFQNAWTGSFLAAGAIASRLRTQASTR
ncbi:MAG TPA: NAD(P)/FAD-dependent oxidoreductase [Robiginitalea sp.]|nr:NAD(P)/FAD-dependent oxidoreductase [Robiginitalea sp.]